MKLRAKLLSIVTPLIVAPLLVLGTVAYIKLYENAAERSLSEMTTLLDNVSNHVTSVINTAKANIDLFSNSVLLEKYLKTKDVNERYSLMQPVLLDEFAGYQKAYPQYYEIRVLLPDGYEDIRATVGNIPNVTEQEAGSEFFHQLKQTEHLYSQVYLNPDNNKYSLLLAKPVLKRKGSVDPVTAKPVLMGYLLVTMSLDLLDNYANNSRVGKTGQIFFINKTMEVVFGVSETLKKGRISSVAAEPGKDNIIFSLISGSANSEEIIYQKRQLTEDLFLLGMMPYAETHAPNDELRKLILITLLVSILAATGLMFIVLRSFVLTPIALLNKASKEVAEGKVVTSLGPYGNDEFGNLDRSFVDMSEKIERSKKELVEARQKAEHASLAKSVFLANMSHEIRTPLTSIIGFSESLLDSDQDMEDRINSINTVIRSGKHLLNIINSILDLSKIEAEKLEIEISDVKLEDIVKDVYLISSPQAQHKGLKFDVEYRLPLPAVIQTDSVRLKQILLNLCSNAIKFTDQGGVRLIVAFAADKNQLRFKVIDTGIGITSEQFCKIFIAFEQADASTTRRYGGTGLGLYLSRKLAEKIDGNISVNSAPGSGSAFTLALNTDPIAAGNMMVEIPDTTSAENAGEEKTACVQLSGRVLLAEDNTDNQKLICLYLQRSGVSCEVVDNGLQAVEKMHSSQYDLVLMDMQMPVMGGLEAIALIRQENTETPLIALTANAMNHDVEQYIKAGCNGFIAKPIEREKFNDVIAQFLQEDVNKTEEIEPLLSALLEEGPGVIDLIRMFVDRIPVLLQEVREQYDNEDWQGVAEKIHNLKGTGGNYGYMQITEVAQKVEFLLARQGYREIEAELYKMDQLCKRIQLGAEQLK